MKTTIRLNLPGGKVGLAIEPSFWLMAAIFGWYAAGGDLRRTALWVFVIGLSVLVHELGHALSHLAFGSGSDIVLHGFGGTTSPRHAGPGRLWQRCVILASGCAAGLALAALARSGAGLAQSGGARYVLGAFTAANLYWSLFNLLPVQPMDGGSLLRTLLQAGLGRLRGLRAAHAAGLAAALLMMPVLYLLGGLYNLALAALLAAGEYRSLRRALSFTPQDEDPGLQQEFRAAQDCWAAGRQEEAVRRLIDLRKRSQAGGIHRAATEQLGLFLYEQKQHGAAYPLLKSLGEELSSTGRSALQALAYGRGEYEEAARLGKRLFYEEQDPRAACEVARAYAAGADPAEAVRWLRTALRNGLPDPARELRSAAFDAIRDDPDFEELERSLAPGGPTGPA